MNKSGKLSFGAIIFILILIITFFYFGYSNSNKVCVKDDVRCYHNRPMAAGRTVVYIHDYGNCTEPYYSQAEKFCVEWREK